LIPKTGTVSTHNWQSDLDTKYLCLTSLTVTSCLSLLKRKSSLATHHRLVVYPNLVLVRAKSKRAKLVPVPAVQNQGVVRSRTSSTRAVPVPAVLMGGSSCVSQGRKDTAQIGSSCQAARISCGGSSCIIRFMRSGSLFPESPELAGGDLLAGWLIDNLGSEQAG
jgi:hypothetical protein